jgi:hypothetical protein
MLHSEVAYGAVLNVEMPLRIVNKRRSGKGGGAHGFVLGVLVSLGVAGVLGGLTVGLRG